ncbi:MAG: hypothetical protein K6A23_04255 [Butyrivibrio sp.]|nr:hypothetical protein [Butyrivibrio sp.]
MKKRIILGLALTLVLSLSCAVPLYCLPAEHVIDGYEPYEPLFVHTPVISPVVIQDEDGNDIPDGGKGSSELVTENDDVWYQLRLDTGYIMHWDSMTHREILGYGDSGEDPSKYDKYTQDKWMKFPFEVLYNDVFYELQADGYTEWIQIKRPSSWSDTTDNHWIDTPIYIPSYAEEMGEEGNEGCIYYKVEAINVDGDLAEHYDEAQEKGNTDFDLVIADDGAKYVATYKIPVQLSGWIYDFTITGINNGALYAGAEVLGTNELSFVMTKKEKKAGTKNRFGESNIRYLIDGTLLGSWSSLDTITLTNGKSTQFSGLGALWKGQTFSFLVKTMANLTSDNGNMDRVEIVPTFTYVDGSGNKVDSDHLKVFYNNSDGSGAYIEYGTSRDTISTNWAATSIGSKMQKGSYYTDEMTDTENGGSARKYHFGDWAGYTADLYNTGHMLTGDDALTSENILNRSVNTYCLSSIILNPKLRLFSGEWEQLSWNTKGTALEYESVKRYSDLDMDGSEDSLWESSDTQRFRTSMQTWYGQYHIPEDIYVVDLNKHPGFDMETYMTTASGGLGITEDDEIFEKGGYLIINFDIKTYKDGNLHMKYLGASSDGDMWTKEGFNTSKLSGDTTSIPSYEEGDVVVIDLEKSVTDKYSAGIFNVN